MRESGFLAECEREPLHLSGHVQPHGALLILNGQGDITHVSENLAAFVPGEPSAWLGAPAPECLRHLALRLPDTPGARLNWECRLEGRTGLLDVMASRGRQESVALELTRPVPLTDHQVQDWMVADWQPLDRQGLVDAVSELTGFERVMYYRFMDNGDGEVKAETRRGEVYGSYLGLRFPASDIPRIARHLYLNNPWRWIPDAGVDPVPVLGRDFQLPDLSWVDLRSVSPVHREYLGNMGVRAALSFPIIVDGELHALVACHHSRPARLGMPLLERTNQVVRQHARVLAQKKARRSSHLEQQLKVRLADAQALLGPRGDLASAWRALGPWLMREFEADGAMLRSPGGDLAVGVVLTPADLAVLDACPFWQEGQDAWMTDSLIQDLPGFCPGRIAGALVVAASPGMPPDVSVVLTRREHVEEIQWGGNPHKALERHGDPAKLSPRSSFEKWIERREGYSRPWGPLATRLVPILREWLTRAWQGA